VELELSIFTSKSDEPNGVPLGTEVHIVPSHFSIAAGVTAAASPTAQLSLALTMSTALSARSSATPGGETAVQAAPFHRSIVGGNPEGASPTAHP
jgi:hypothetical protein